MVVRRWARDARLSLARFPGLVRRSRVPDAPACTIRDLWVGSPALGARLLQGEVTVSQKPYSFSLGQWNNPDLPTAVRRYMHGFSWLRDMHALGTDAARLRTRAMVSDWLLYASREDEISTDPSVVACRMVAWLGHYDFFAASADDDFRQRVMGRLMIEGRTLAAMVPPVAHDRQVIGVLKGLLAAAVAFPAQEGFLSRFMRYIDVELGRQILEDGTHAQRSPEAQLQVLRDLAEMKSMMQTAQLPVPDSISVCIERMSSVLRSMRHGDGRLALFNGTFEQDQTLIDTVLSQATRSRVAAAAMPQGRFIRCQARRSILIIDAGEPPTLGAEAHAGALSFELSIGQQRLVVNCGTSAQPHWREALRSTAAHSVMSLGYMGDSGFVAHDGLSYRPVHIGLEQDYHGGAHLIRMTNDGYKKAFGVSYTRTLFLSSNGDNLRGEDSIEAGDPNCHVTCVIRFHLHPNVVAAQEPETGLVWLHYDTHTGRREQWCFRAEGGVVTLEDSVYGGSGLVVPTKQIAIWVIPEKSLQAFMAQASGEEGAAAGAEDAAPEGADTPELLVEQEKGEQPSSDDIPAEEAPEDGENRPLIRWAFQRIVS